ncbi:MAG TPA: XdhC family protein [Solirubrobacteraceae bacterium]|nr:XdhC family protein [Solirubrobacteraceae bacterium]
MTEEIAGSETRAAWERESELHGPGFAEPESPAPRLVMFGAVPLAAALCTLGSALGWRPYVVDPRERFALAERFPGAADVVVAWPEEAFARLGGIDAATAVLLLTHDPVLDDPALEIALRSDAMFVGAMGSRRTQASRRERLRAAGLGEEELGRLSGPIGLDTGARTARETALAILAEIVAVRHGRDGGRLTVGNGPIHEVPA